MALADGGGAPLARACAGIEQRRPGFSTRCSTSSRRERADRGQRSRAAARAEELVVGLGRRQDRARAPASTGPDRCPPPAQRLRPRLRPHRADAPGRRARPPGTARARGSQGAAACSPPDRSASATLADLCDYHRQKTTPCKPLVAELVEEGRLVPVDGRGLGSTGVPPPRCRRARDACRREPCSARSTR